VQQAVQLAQFTSAPFSLISALRVRRSQAEKLPGRQILLFSQIFDGYFCPVIHFYQYLSFGQVHIIIL
jgi:hypothetical protein